MPRPQSDEKRAAILESATNAIASLGLSAATAKIAKDAGVADGTLFVYFASKDELHNHLYISLKENLREAVVLGYPSRSSVKNKFRHFWNRYVDWGLRFPEKRRAMQRLSVSGRLTESSRKAGWRIFTDVEEMIDEGFRSGVLRKQPIDFLGGVMEGIADITIEMMLRDRSKSEEAKLFGWKAFWGAISIN